MIRLEDIHFHDSEILKVTEYPDRSEIHYLLHYPCDWKNNIFENKNLVFFNVSFHRIDEMPFVGNPSILDADFEYDGDKITIKFETNAGNRIIIFSGGFKF